MHREIPVKVKKTCLLITLKGLTTFKTTVLVTMQATHARARAHHVCCHCAHTWNVFTRNLGVTGCVIRAVEITFI